MANKQDYLAELRAVIHRLHACGAVHLRTVPVHEQFQGKTVWKGEVEVFELKQHPTAKIVYAWAHLEGKNDEKTRFVTILEIPPVNSARTAVQASIVADGKMGK